MAKLMTIILIALSISGQAQDTIIIPCGFALKLVQDCRDIDGDGICINEDNCPLHFNPDQANADEDLRGDVCEDDDNDNIVAVEDNCPEDFNPDQTDLDSDGIGDVCDEDSDGDGILNDVDNCPLIASPDTTDTDGDGEGDICDIDLDGDLILNGQDNCPNDFNAVEFLQIDTSYDTSGLIVSIDSTFGQPDFDGDGIGDACDDDVDNDGILNTSDACPTVAGTIGSQCEGTGCVVYGTINTSCECDPTAGPHLYTATLNGFSSIKNYPTSSSLQPEIRNMRLDFIDSIGTTYNVGFTNPNNASFVSADLQKNETFVIVSVKGPTWNIFQNEFANPPSSSFTLVISSANFSCQKSYGFIINWRWRYSVSSWNTLTPYYVTITEL